MTIITPTIGRRVWYWPSAQDLGQTEAPPLSRMESFSSTQAFDAGVCCVWGDRMVNLTVADHGGATHSRRSVTLIQEGDALPVPGSVPYATWMPYQQGQAKKHEAQPQPPADDEHVAVGASLFSDPAQIKAA